MAEEVQGTKSVISLGDAIKDLGWFPAILSTVVGAPSFLSLLQTLRRSGLSASLQWIVDGYRDLSSELAAWIEPVSNWLVAHINFLLGTQLSLHPHWVPLFILQMIYLASMTRIHMRRSIRAGIGWAIAAAVIVVACAGFALVGATIAGLVPLQGVWWAQGLIAVIPMVSLSLIPAMFGITIQRIRMGSAVGVGAEIVQFTFGWAVLAATVFAVAATLSVGVLGAGLWTFAAVIAMLAVSILVNGLGLSDSNDTRVGLTMLSAFVAAGAIVLADTLIKVLT